MHIDSYGSPLLIDGKDAVVLPRLPLGATTGSMAYDENYVRNLAFDFPSCLPITEIDSAYRHAVPVCKELNTPAGPIDALFVTPEGRLVILEAKLWRNPEARRKVVAQILDYAKELSRWDYDDLQRVVSAATGRKGNALMEIVQERHPEIDEITFVDSVSRGLKQGRFLLLIVGDGIREGAASIAEFIQRVGTLEFTFGLVELALYGTEKTGILVQPRVIAKTEIIQRSVIVMRAGRLELDDEPLSAEQETAISDAAHWYLDFWSELVADLRFDDPEQPTAKPGKGGNLFFSVPPGKGLAWMSAYFLQKSGSVGVYLTFQRGGLAERLYAGLLAEKDVIDQELGIPTVWEQAEDGKCSIISYRTYQDVKDPLKRREIMEFLKLALNRYVNSFRPRLKRLTEET